MCSAGSRPEKVVALGNCAERLRSAIDISEVSEGLESVLLALLRPVPSRRDLPLGRDGAYSKSLLAGNRDMTTVPDQPSSELHRCLGCSSARPHRMPPV